MAISPGPYLKAIVAGTLAGLGTLYAAQGDGVITAQEWTQVAIYTITAAAAIYGVPNTPAPAPAPAPPQLPDPGAYLPPAPATRWPAAAVNTAAAGLTPEDAAALAASAAARTPGAGA